MLDELLFTMTYGDDSRLANDLREVIESLKRSPLDPEQEDLIYRACIIAFKYGERQGFESGLDQ